MRRMAIEMWVVVGALVGSAGADSTALHSGMSHDLALTGGGNFGLVGSYALLTDPAGGLAGVLNYYDLYDAAWRVVGHRLDRHDAAGAFVETLAQDGASGWGSFVAVRGRDIYVGRTGLDPTQDAIEKVQDGALVEVAKVRQNYAMAFAPDGGAYVSCMDGSARIVKLDGSGGPPKLVAELDGFSSGLAFDGRGDLYCGTFRLGGGNQILRFAAGRVDPDGPGFAVLTPADADVVTDLPHGAASVAIDGAGNVIFTMNSPYGLEPEYHALAVIWAGKDYGGYGPFRYDVLSTGRCYLGGAAALGDVRDYDGVAPDNAAFAAGWGALSYVPEPASLLVLALLGLGVLRRRAGPLALARRLAGVAATACALGAGAEAARAASIPQYEQFFASRVVDYAPGPGNDFYSDPTWALGGPYGGGPAVGSYDVVTLGLRGRLTLGFPDGKVLADGPGADFIVFENPIISNSTGLTYAELLRVQVSSDGVHFAEFPTRSRVPGPVGPFEGIDPSLVSGFAGVRPVLANLEENQIDPFSPPEAGGDAFDLADLAADPNVLGGLVRLDRVRCVRLIDVLGDGSELDSARQPIYDPSGWADLGPPGYQRRLPVSADIDAVAVIHGAEEPADLAQGDADGDGDVDFLDYLTVKGNFGLADGARWQDGDFDADGDVDFFDYLAVKANFGAGGSGGIDGAGEPVPEPAGASALALAALAALPRRAPASAGRAATVRDRMQ